MRARLALAALWVLAPAALAQQPTMTAHFIDVGQAHAALLEFPCGAMLVDAGSDEEHPDALVDYLTRFFERRTDLNRTLDVVLITHNHIDHTRSLRAVVEGFTVRRYFDNGVETGPGAANPNWLRREVGAGRRNLVVQAVLQRTIDSAGGQNGLTDGEIDPFNCGIVDPEVHILAGAREVNPGWPEGDFTNQNNHSLVTRIDFDEASFLFMGDLEESGIESLLDRYGSTASGALNTDILQVGHHGSGNATTPALLQAVTPNVAVIAVGEWTFGRGSQARFTTFAFGHPRANVVSLLSMNLLRFRAQPKGVMVADRARRFHRTIVRKAIYATGWDGTVRVVARPQGTFTVYREH